MQKGQKINLGRCLHLEFHFDNKVVLITGGSGVLGSKMASALYQLGCSVYICNRNLENGEAKAAEIEKACGRGEIMARQVNVLERDSVQKLAEEVKKTHGRSYQHF